MLLVDLRCFYNVCIKSKLFKITTNAPVATYNLNFRGYRDNSKKLSISNGNFKLTEETDKKNTFKRNIIFLYTE